MRTITACLLAIALTACAASGTGDLAPDPGTPDADPVAALVAVVADAGPDVEASTLPQDASADVAPTVDGAPDAGAASCGQLPSTDYCADDSGATSAYWCHGPPGTNAAPDAGGCSLALSADPSPTIWVAYWCCP
jgi:hypothetical protein